MQSAKIATININGLYNRTRVGMLLDLIRRHDLDFVFLQVTDPAILNVTGYGTYLNIVLIYAGRPYWQNTIFPSLT